MSSPANGARAQLVSALRRGFPTDFPEQPTPNGMPTRRSSVLILFGALDDVPAASAAGHVSAELDVLLTRRSNQLRYHPGQIAFPGGGQDPEDAGPVEAALREAQEETDLDPTGIDVLGEMPVAHIPVSNNLVTPVIGWWREPSEVAADHSESIEVFRVPVAELLDPRWRGTCIARRGHMKYTSEAFKLSDRFGGHVVWGFTARLLSRVFDEAGWAEPWSRDNTYEIALT